MNEELLNCIEVCSFVLVLQDLHSLVHGDECVGLF